MPRRSSGGRATARGARSTPLRNPPQPVQQAPPPAPVRGSSMLSGIGSTIADGVALGTGSAIAHRAVDAVLGPRTFHHETVVSQAPSMAAAPVSGSAGMDACSMHSKAFQDCISSLGSDISKCQFYVDMLNECRRNSGAMQGA